MKATLKLATLAALLALGAATPVAAADLGYGIKFGVGPALTDPAEQQSRATLNLALTGDWKFAPGKELFAELNYRYFKADQRDVTPFTDSYQAYDYYGGGPYTVNYAAVNLPGVGAGYIFNADPNYSTRGSADIRRDNIEGLGLSIGYRHQLGQSAFHLQGGLMLTALKYEQEVVGELRVYTNLPQADGSIPANTLLYQEGLNYVPSETALKPGAFVGVQARLTPNFFLEANVTYMGYDKVIYMPFTYTGQAATTKTESDSKVVLDFNIGFRF